MPVGDQTYARVGDIKDMFTNFPTRSTDSIIGDSSINEQLYHSFQVINGRIAAFYETPILESTSPCSFRILRELQTFYVADVFWRVLNPQKSPDEGPRWDTKFTSLMDEIAPKKQGEYPKLLLTDANYIGTKIQRSIVSGSTDDPIFTKSGDQW